MALFAQCLTIGNVKSEFLEPCPWLYVIRLNVATFLIAVYACVVVSLKNRLSPNLMSILLFITLPFSILGDSTSPTRVPFTYIPLTKVNFGFFRKWRSFSATCHIHAFCTTVFSDWVPFVGSVLKLDGTLTTYSGQRGIYPFCFRDSIFCLLCVPFIMHNSNVPYMNCTQKSLSVN